MTRVLFAERFTVPPTASAEKVCDASYDAARGYTVSAAGVPLVDLAAADNTTTLTFVEAESSDTDRDWQPLLDSVDTSTRARLDRDHWGG